MSRQALTISSADLGPHVLTVPVTPSGIEIAQAVREFLHKTQPSLAALVEVEAEGDCATVSPLSSSTPERTLDLLRAVEGVLGMEDKLPEVLDADALPEIEVDPHEFLSNVILESDEPWEGPERLRSRVRYFPLPTCEWYEISEGHLILAPDCVLFEPRFVIISEKGSTASGRHVIPLSAIKVVTRDTWWYVPCIRVEAGNRAYRYGWPERRDTPSSDFQVDEWLEHFERARWAKA